MSSAEIALLLSSIGAKAFSGIAGSRSSRKDREAGERLTRERIASDERLSAQDLAFKESLADPFRQQMSQAKALRKLDMLERARYRPTRLTPAAPYASYVPEVSGGFSYEQSPELTQDAAALKRNVRGGNVAPTMTNPANYGRTSTLDLIRMAADGVDPATVRAGARGGPRRRVTTPMDGRGSMDDLAAAPRRGGGRGGIAKGAAMGAAAGMVLPGALIGAFSKRAPTAATDLDVATAQQVLGQAIQDQLGRTPRPGEIEEMLVGQGLKPGDRWVGDAGMRALLAAIRQQPPQPDALTPSYVGIG